MGEGQGDTQVRSSVLRELSSVGTEPRQAKQTLSTQWFSDSLQASNEMSSKLKN